MVFDPSDAGKAFSHNIFRLTFSQCDSKTKKLLKVQTPNSQHFFDHVILINACQKDDQDPNMKKKTLSLEEKNCKEFLPIIHLSQLG